MKKETKAKNRLNNDKNNINNISDVTKSLSQLSILNKNIGIDGITFKEVEESITNNKTTHIHKPSDETISEIDKALNICLFQIENNRRNIQKEAEELVKIHILLFELTKLF